MYLCYIDESGTPEVPGNTSHFVLAGLALPIWRWNDADRQISAIMSRYDLADAELHTAWLLRPYLEQRQIPGFDHMGRPARRSAVERARNTHLLKLQQTNRHKAYQQARKNYNHTKDYIHLTYDERVKVLHEVADCVASWGYARLFAECINKLHFDPRRTARTIEEQAFEQVVSRFERYLTNTSAGAPEKVYGLLIHDNNQTVERKHTRLMRHFHVHGTPWTPLDHIIETPLFVNSSLTSMVQMADLCAYALRRFVENQETALFDRIFQRADRAGVSSSRPEGYTVGIRHFAGLACRCQICVSHV